MSTAEGPAAPASGSDDDIPTFEELAADPEIAALLDFEPVPRQVARPNGWTPDRQREFIALLAWFGVPKLATDAMGKNVSGVTPLYKQKGSDSFRAAWKGAIALHASRQPPESGSAFLGQIPGMNLRRLENRLQPEAAAGPLDGLGDPPHAGQILNEYGEWEEEDSLHRRAGEARDRISAKLLAARRLYLQEISSSPGRRAAFELLTGLPVDWDAAARLESQEDEPWRTPNLREPDMLLTAENGWLGAYAHGRDKIAELRAAIDAQRAAEDLPPVDWSENLPSPRSRGEDGLAQGEPGEGPDQ